MSNPGTFEKLHVDWQPAILGILNVVPVLWPVDGSSILGILNVVPVLWPVDGSSILGILNVYIYIYTCHVCI